MRLPRPARVALISGALTAALTLATAQVSRDQELFNQGKIRIFERDYSAARETFQRVLREHPQSAIAPQASYFIARCYQFESRDEDAIQAYEEFLRKYPSEPFLPVDARNAVVELAARFMEKGDKTYRNRLLSALSDPDKEVRYFAAIRVSRLQDSHIQSMAIPILKDVVERASERDLVDRARIALLRLEPKALEKSVEAPVQPRKRESGAQRMFHLEVYQKGASRPTVELNIPVSLAQLAIAALDDSARRELRKKGVDIDNVWESLQKLGPTNILTFRDGENLIKLWID